MSSARQSAKKQAALCIAGVLLGTSIACSGGTTSPSPTAALTISPAQLQASLNDPSTPDRRYLINPSVTFSATGMAASMVKEVRFTFIVDADRVIEQGALLVHGGDLRRGPVTQQYPLTFDVPVHFPNLRVQMRAIFVDDSGAETTTQPGEASIQLPGARP